MKTENYIEKKEVLGLKLANAQLKDLVNKKTKLVEETK